MALTPKPARACSENRQPAPVPGRPVRLRGGRRVPPRRRPQLPPGDRNPGLPEGETQFIADDVIYTGHFVKVALNVARHAGQPGNALGDLLRSWFGPDAGQPGTVQFVELVPGKPHWQMRPVSPTGRRAESAG